MMKQSFWSLAAALCFSLMAAVVKLSTDELGTLELVFYRSLFGVVSILAYVWRNHLSVRTRYWAGHLNRSVLGTFAYTLWFYTLGYLPFGTNMTLTYTTALFMSANFVLLAWMQHRRAPWSLIVPIIVGFIGIVIVLRPSLSSDEIWPALGCLTVGAVDLAVYWQMKQLGRVHEPSWRIVFYFSLFGALFGLLGAECVEGGLHALTPTSAATILGVGAFATLGQICTTRSYAYGNMLLSSCLGFSAIPFSALIGWLLFDDAVGALSLVGMSLILGAGVAGTIATKREEKAQKPQA